MLAEQSGAKTDRAGRVGQAARTVSVPRFTATALGLDASPTSLRRGRGIVAAGELVRPAGVSASQGCGSGRVTLVLKGARTLVALADGTVSVNPTGNPGMSTGGTGDVLSGVLGALLAQGLEAPTAARTAVYVHGLAGDLMVERRGQRGLIATDVVEGLCGVWTRWHR